MARVVRKHVRLLPSDSERLFHGQLLNGEIISAYLRFLERRNARDCSLPNVLALDSYFFSVLRRSGHERARGHHHDQDLLAYEIIPSPYMRSWRTSATGPVLVPLRWPDFSFPGQPCGLRVFLCAIAGDIYGGREAKELQVDGREFRRQMARELREDSVTEIKSSQLELFPGEEPDWSFDDLAEDLE
ncbi:hypothetical protein J6590_075942 [Homalodisca vitripennis]|nr:hypothetical protein J6590_075942 [Homalodisca vitripennis]